MMYQIPLNENSRESIHLEITGKLLRARTVNLNEKNIS